MARTLTLLKHARPEKIEGVDSHEWPLSPQGREDVGRLAKALSGRAYAAIVSSPEPKAAETASLLATHLSLTPTTDPGLMEHDRSNVPMMKTPEFVSAIANFFKRPTQVVLGNESGKQALKRFEAAVDRALTANPTGDLLIVSHGTVLALWLAHYVHIDPYTIWREMGLPSYVDLAWPECEIIGRLDKV